MSTPVRKNSSGAITYNVLQIGGRFNAAKPLLYAGTVNSAET
jgi:hypothetical protein